MTEKINLNIERLLIRRILVNSQETIETTRRKNNEHSDGLIKTREKRMFLINLWKCERKFANNL